MRPAYWREQGARLGRSLQSLFRDVAMDLRRRSKNRVVEAMAGGADLAIGKSLGSPFAAARASAER